MLCLLPCGLTTCATGIRSGARYAFGSAGWTSGRRYSPEACLLLPPAAACCTRGRSLPQTAERASACASGTAVRLLPVAWPAVWRQLQVLLGLATPALLLLLAGVRCRARMATAAACCIHGTSLPQMAEPASVCASGTAARSLLAAWPAAWRKLQALLGLATQALLLLLAGDVCRDRMTTAVACCIHETSLPQTAAPASVCASGTASRLLLAAWPAVCRQLQALP